MAQQQQFQMSKVIETEFRARGLSFSRWCSDRGFDPRSVAAALDGDQPMIPSLQLDMSEVLGSWVTKFTVSAYSTAA